MIALVKSWSVPTEWLPSSVGGIILMVLVILGVSWWLTGRFFKEQDLITLIFRCLISLLICFAIGLFDRSLVGFVRQVWPAQVAQTAAERDKRILGNMQQWVTPAACAACLKPVPPDPVRLKQMSMAELKEFQASQVNPEILADSAVRGLMWMALEHRQPSTLGRNLYPHAERGTKPLNTLTVAQAQAMFDYLQLVNPRLVADAQPFLADALAYCREGIPPAEASAKQPGPAGEHSVKPAGPAYPRIEVSRPAEKGRAYVVRVSPTEVRVIEAASEQEALKKAKEP
jgi:hypothetical protein